MILLTWDRCQPRSPTAVPLLKRTTTEAVLIRFFVAASLGDILHIEVHFEAANEVTEFAPLTIKGKDGARLTHLCHAGLIQCLGSW